MKFLKIASTFVSTGLIVLSSSCGSKHSDRENTASQKPEKNEETTAPSPSNLPTATIVAVPVDQNGQEQPANAELRLLSQDAGSIDGVQIQNAFAAGQKPTLELAELDQSTSTQSYNGWHTSRNYGNYGNYGSYQTRGRNNYSNSNYYNYNCNDYRQYRPVYYSSGRSYDWSYQSSYHSSSVNYYYYRQNNWSQNNGHSHHSGPRNRNGRW